MRKILLVIESMGGGAFTYIVDLANGLVDTYEVFLAYAIREQTPKDFRNYFDSRIHMHRVRHFTRSLNIKEDIQAFFELKEIARWIKPDIIHLHSSKAGALGRWAFQGRKIPLFYTPHGYSFLMTDSGNVKSAIYKVGEVLSSKRRCTTISCSPGEHQETSKLTKRAMYVNNGINTIQMNQLIAAQQYQQAKEFTVFTLGRICQQKNPELFNKIALLLPEVRFVWIGDGELRLQLSAPNIEIAGWMERSEAIAKSLEAHAFILTSLWEGLPISLLEAMYMKRPCIVSDVIGNHDVIKSGRNGYVCRTAEEFVAAITSCREQDGEPLVRQAYQDILTSYNTEVMVENYKYIFEAALSDRSPGGYYGTNSDFTRAGEARCRGR